MPGARDKGTDGVGGGYREGIKEEVKEMAGVEKRKGRRVKMLLQSQERCAFCRAPVYLRHIVTDPCVCVHTSCCCLMPHVLN